MIYFFHLYFFAKKCKIQKWETDHFIYIVWWLYFDSNKLWIEVTPWMVLYHSFQYQILIGASIIKSAIKNDFFWVENAKDYIKMRFFFQNVPTYSCLVYIEHLVRFYINYSEKMKKFEEKWDFFHTPNMHLSWCIGLIKSPLLILCISTSKLRWCINSRGVYINP